MSKINLLAVSVGNTRTRVGGFVDDELIDVATFVNEKDAKIADAIDRAYAPLKGKDDAAILLSSVAPKASGRIEKTIADHLGERVYRVERDVNIPIGRQLDPGAVVGEDRLLNAAAAFDVMGQACVVVDAGTAITVDFVDGQGTFHGGAIGPGAQLQLDALHSRTEQLPELEICKPDEIIGHNTVEAMKTGVFYGLRGMVRELVEKFAEHIGQYPMVIATGGDGNLLFRDYELVDRVIPNLTLMGLATTMRKSVEDGDGPEKDAQDASNN